MTPRLLNSFLPNLTRGNRFFAVYDSNAWGGRIAIFAQVESIEKGIARCWVINGNWYFNCDLRGIAEDDFPMYDYWYPKPVGLSHSAAIRVLDCDFKWEGYNDACIKAEQILREMTSTDASQPITTIRPFQKLNTSWTTCE